MREPKERPDGSYSIHIRKPTPAKAISAAGKARAKASLGEASQLIPTQPHAPRPGESATFRPIDLPGDVGGEAPLELDMGRSTFELELQPPDTPLSPAEHPGVDLDLADVARAPSSFERASQHADRQISFKYVLPRQAEPWWRRKLAHIITGAILMGVASYIYGCTKVMGDSIAFRRDMPGVAQKLHNINGRFETLTPKKVEAAVKQIADRHDLDIERVDVVAEEIGNQGGNGISGCSPRHWPNAIEFLDPIDKMNLIKLGRVCKIPEYILTIRAHVEERWGLFHHELDEVAYVLVHKYSPFEDVDGYGASEYEE